MGVPISYGDPHELRDLLKLHQPEIMGCVPRVLEKIREAVEAQVEQMPNWKRTAARRLFRVVLERARRASQGQAADVSSLVNGLPRWLLARRIRRQLGGLRYFICGGAWLDPELELFFRSVGFVVLQGYGMTETSPVITFSRLGHEKLGAVGQALCGVELRLSEEGEIMTRGPHTMLGYYNDAEATASAFHDGWLLTGDLGSLDPQGFLHITGRRKEMLVLSNGKKVGCAPLEHALERGSLIQNAFLVGEGRKFASVLIVPHLKNLAQLARDSGIPFGNDRELLQAAPVWSLVRREIDTQQAEFSNFERAKRFCFLSEEALLDPELVTPTQKVRRDVLERKYADWIARMYLQEDPLVISEPVTTADALSIHV
jgi:long-chain acyl-CoA synthetase